MYLDNTKSHQYFDCLSRQQANWIKINWRQICINNKTNKCCATAKPLRFKLWLLVPCAYVVARTFPILGKTVDEGKNFYANYSENCQTIKTQTELEVCFTCRKCSRATMPAVTLFFPPSPISFFQLSLDSEHVQAALRRGVSIPWRNLRNDVAAKRCAFFTWRRGKPFTFTIYTDSSSPSTFPVLHTLPPSLSCLSCWSFFLLLRCLSAN